MIVLTFKFEISNSDVYRSEFGIGHRKMDDESPVWGTYLRSSLAIR